MKFELKKLYKNKTILITVILSLLVVIYGNYFKNNLSENYKLSQSLDGGHLVNYSVADSGYFLNYDPINGYTLEGASDEVASKFIEIREKMPEINVEFNNDRVQEIPYYEKESYVELKQFIDDNSINTSPIVKDKLDYIIESYTYLESNNEDIYQILNRQNLSFQEVFLSNLDFYFGFIAIIFFMFIAGINISKDYYSGKIGFLWTQKKGKKNYIKNKFLALSVLPIIYVLFICLFSLLIGLINGNIEFFLGFPLEVFSEVLASIRIEVFLLCTVIFFILKCICVISIGLFIGLVFKTPSVFITFTSFFSLVIFILIDSFDILKSYFNPFYTNYKNFLLGFKDIDLESSYAYFYKYFEPEISILHIISLIIVIIIFVIGCRLILDQETYVNISVKYKIITKKMSLFSWENYKQNKYLSNVFVYYLSIILLGMLIYSTTRYDSDMVNLIVNNPFEATMYNSEYDANEKNIELLRDQIQNPVDGQDNQQLESEIQDLVDRNIELEALIDEVSPAKDYINSDSKAFYEKLNNNYLNNTPQNFSILEQTEIKLEDLTNKQISEKSIQLNNEFRNYLLKSDIKPMALDFGRQVSEFDKTINSKVLDRVILHHQPYDSSSFILLYRLIEFKHLDLFLIIIPTLLYGLKYKIDRANGKQIDFLYTQPLSKKKIFKTKYLSGLYLGIIFILLIVLVIVGYGLLFNPINTLNYPIVQYFSKQGDLSYSFITLKIYLIRNMFRILLTYGILYTIVIYVDSKFRY